MPTIAQQVAAILAGQQAPVSIAFQQANARATRDRRELAATQRALVAQLQRGTGPAGHLYDQAVNQQQALAHAAASELAAASPDTGIQENLAAIGAPAAQRAMLGAQNQRDFAGQGAVQYTAQGAIPGAGLVAQKAAVQSYLAGLPTVAALAGQQADRALIARQGQSRDQYLQEIARIQGQTPQLVQSLQAAQAEQAYRQQQAAAEAAYRAAELGLAQERIATTRRGQDLTNQRATQGKEKSAGAKRQSSFYSTRSKAFAQARKLYGIEIPNKVQPTPPQPGKVTNESLLSGSQQPKVVKHRRYSRGGAYNVLYSTYAPQLIAQGFSPTTVQRMIDKALASAGYPMADRTAAGGSTRSRRRKPKQPRNVVLSPTPALDLLIGG